MRFVAQLERTSAVGAGSSLRYVTIPNAQDEADARHVAGALCEAAERVREVRPATWHTYSRVKGD